MRYLSLIILFFIAFTACSEEKYVKPTDPVNVAFEKAMEFYENEEYRDAADAFEMVHSLARGTNYARDAQYYMAESYYKNEQYLVAANEYRRYYSTYPNDQRREETQYKEALSHFQMSPRYKLDQTESKKALELFQLFVLRYPNSEFSTEAGDKIDIIRNKLARKKFNAAEFYMLNREYEAAAKYFGMIVDQYPETALAEDALFNQIQAFLDFAENSVANKQQERYNMALDSYQKYIQLFPGGEHRSEVENLYDEIQTSLDNIASR